MVTALRCRLPWRVLLPTADRQFEASAAKPSHYQISSRIPSALDRGCIAEDRALLAGTMDACEPAATVVRDHILGWRPAPMRKGHVCQRYCAVALHLAVRPSLRMTAMPTAVGRCTGQWPDAACGSARGKRTAPSRTHKATDLLSGPGLNPSSCPVELVAVPIVSAHHARCGKHRQQASGFPPVRPVDGAHCGESAPRKAHGLHIKRSLLPAPTRLWSKQETSIAGGCLAPRGDTAAASRAWAPDLATLDVRAVARPPASPLPSPRVGGPSMPQLRRYGQPGQTDPRRPSCSRTHGIHQCAKDSAAR